VKRILLTVVLLAAAGSAWLAHAQSADPQRPTFRAGVELVRLDVRVVDDQGRPVTDLRPDEIRIEEGGSARPVVLFQHVAEPRGTYLEAAQRTIGAEVSTNQGAPRGHLYVFVFDQNHITPGNEQRARAAVERFLRSRVRPGDRVALYAVPPPGPQLGFSSNVSAALAELGKIRGSLERQVGVGISAMSLFEAYQIARGDQRIVQRVLERSTEGASTVDVNARAASARSGGVTAGTVSTGESLTQSTQIVTDAARSLIGTADSESRAFLYSLADIIRELAGVEGRKSVLLISEGFYADNVTRDVDRVSAAAAEAYAVIYSIDINRRGVDISAAGPSGAEPAIEVQSRVESLAGLAAETSGELVLDSGGQMDRVLERIADASQDYYIVGFAPPAAALDGRHSYRRVNVRVTRPGVRVATRTGYSLRDPAGPADQRRSIDAALASPFAQQGLPVEMTTYVLRGTSPGAQRVFVSLQADVPAAGQGEARRADVVFVVRRATDGRVVSSGSDTLPLPAAGSSTMPGRFNVQFDLPAGSYLMRAVVREPGGATGTVDRRFDVRALDGADVTMSDLVLGRRQERLPVRPIGYADEGLTGALEVYARRADDLSDADVTVDLFRIGGETPVRSIKAEIAPVRVLGTGAARSASLSMPLSGVESGDYVARATLRSRGETVTEVMRQVRVVPGRAPAVANPADEPVTPLMMVNGELGRRFLAAIRADGVGRVDAQALNSADAGAWEKVVAALGPAPEGQPAAAFALRGLALFALGRMEEAGTAMARASSLDERSALTAFFLGWIRSAEGRSADAISAWRHASAADPSLVSAYLALADAYVKLSHPELAAQALRDGLRRNPGSAEIKSRLDEVERGRL
jgi:VWFA-related protein